MADDPSAFRDAFDRWVEATYPEPSDHPPAERWAAFLGGELPAAEVERCEDHLVRCRDCFDLVTALDAFREPPAPDGQLAPDGGDEIGAAALLRLVRQRIRESPQSAAPPAVSSLRQGAPRRHLYALAAALSAALLGTVVWSLHLRSTVDSLRAPQPDAQIADLSSPERAASPTGGEAAAQTGPLTLILHPPGGLAGYHLRILDLPSGHERLASTVLLLDANQALKLHLPEGLPPGRYRLLIYAGTDPQGDRVLETLYLRVAEADRRD